MPLASHASTELTPASMKLSFVWVFCSMAMSRNTSWNRVQWFIVDLVHAAGLVFVFRFCCCHSARLQLMTLAGLGWCHQQCCG